MTPSLVTIESFKVAGPNVRTDLATELNPDTERLKPMWTRFLEGNVMASIPNQVDGSTVYGVYSDYQSDQNGPYTATAGLRVSTDVGNVPDLHTVVVNGGDYLVFEAEGPIPDVVGKVWREIWAYFENGADYRRRYSTDFERYANADSVAVYISVER